MNTGEITKRGTLGRVTEIGERNGQGVTVVRGVVRVREGGGCYFTGNGIQSLFEGSREVIISIQDLEKDADYLVHSDNVLQEKIREKNYNRSNLFTNWEINIRKLYTIFDIILEIFYHCMGYYESIENLQVYYYGEYLVKKLVKLFSSENLSSDNQRKLKESIKESALFKRKISSCSKITEEDALGILKQVKLKLDGKEVGYQAKALKREVETIEKADRKEVSENKLDEKAPQLKLAKACFENKKYFEAIDYYNQIINRCWWESRKQEIMLKALEGLEAVYQFAYENGERNFYQKYTRYPAIGTELMKICRTKGWYHLTINYCEKIISRPNAHFYNDTELCRRGLIRIMYDLIDCYRHIKDSYHEIECYERILNIPDLSWEDEYAALKGLANAFIRKKNFDRAIEVYERSLKFSYRFDTLDTLSELYFKANNSEKAIEHFYRVIRTPEIDVKRKCSAYQSLAILYRKLGKTGDEVKCYELIVSCPGVIPKDYFKALCCLAEFHKNDIEKVLGYFRQMVKTSVIKGRTKKKMRLLAPTQWVDFYHKTPQVKISESDLSLILAKLEGICNYPKKIKCCKSILKLKDLPSNGLHRLALLFKQMNEGVGEIDCYERILKIEGITFDSRIRSLERLTILYSNINNVDKAKQCYEESVSCGLRIEEQYVLLSHLSEAYERVDDTAKAIKCYETILTTFGKVAECEYFALNKLASIYVRMSKSEMAIEYYERILESKNIDEGFKVRAIRGLAEIFTTEDLDKAIEYCEKILNFPKALPNDHLFAIEQLGKIYNQFKDTERGIATYERILNFPEIVLLVKHRVLQELIKGYCKIQNSSKEMEYCEMDLILVRKLNLNSILLLERLIKLYNRIGNNDSKLIDCYEAILQLPGSDAWHLAMSEKLFSLYRAMEDTVTQIKCYERFIKLEGLKDIIKINALKMLLGLYHQVGNKSKILEYKGKLVQLGFNLSFESEECEQNKG